MTTNFLFTQAPNRKGNTSKHTATGKGGVTAVTRPQGSTSYSVGYTGNHSASGKVNGRNQKVQVSQPCCYDTKSTNTGYLKNSSYLK